MTTAGHGNGGHGRSTGTGTSKNARRRRVEEPEEHENHERWAVSYADMMTVIAGLFIMLFAMSQVDQAKYEALKESLAAAFGHDPATLTGTTGVLDSNPPASTSSPGPTDIPGANDQANYQAAATEYARLTGIADQLSSALAGQGLRDRVEFQITDRGLVVGLRADDVFFSANSADLTGVALSVIDTIGSVLTGLTDQISVEGHANTVPATGRYGSNWELSADRAVQVLRRLVEHDGLPATRIVASGYGDAYPVANDHGDPLTANRRVDLVVVSPLSEAQRAYLPQIAATSGKG